MELHGQTGRSMFGRRYVLPALVTRGLETVFAESVADVVVIEYSRYARLHWGARATTRPNRILLAGSGAAFVRTRNSCCMSIFTSCGSGRQDS